MAGLATPKFVFLSTRSLEKLSVVAVYVVNPRVQASHASNVRNAFEHSRSKRCAVRCTFPYRRLFNAEKALVTFTGDHSWCCPDVGYG